MVVAIAMAAFGFVNGYVGTAGAPYCGSLGQCLQRVVDAGPPWFYPAAIIPGAIAALAFAAFVYVLYLVVFGIRKTLGPQPVRPATSAPHEAAPEVTQPTTSAWRAPKAVLPVAFVGVFLVGGMVGYGLHPATTAEQTQALLHARVQECVAQFQVTHLWPNSCPPVNPPETEAQLAIESLCPRGWGWSSVTGATCNDPSANPTSP